jgi:hypothetical protein
MDRLRCEDGTFQEEGRLLKVQCLHCGKERSVYLSQYKSGRGRYCSKSCLAKSKVRERHPAWGEDTFRTSVNGINKYRYQLIAESALGRPMKSTEIVHHIDGNRHNNANSNLLICDESYHRLIHYRMNPDAYEKGLVHGRGWQKK